MQGFPLLLRAPTFDCRVYSAPPEREFIIARNILDTGTHNTVR